MEALFFVGVVLGSLYLMLLFLLWNDRSSLAYLIKLVLCVVLVAIYIIGQSYWVAVIWGLNLALNFFALADAMEDEGYWY